jgi:hypothetical protein
MQTSQRVGTAVGIAVITAVFYGMNHLAGYATAMTLSFVAIILLVLALAACGAQDQPAETAAADPGGAWGSHEAGKPWLNLGADGALTGKSSLARGQLLRREALELALYTFRYLPDVDSVLALLPTIPAGAQTKGGPTTEPQSQAVFYRPGDLKQQLQTPLRFTMAPKSLGPAGIGAGDGRRVDALTLSNLFLWSLQHAQTGETYLVLDHAKTG